MKWIKAFLRHLAIAWHKAHIAQCEHVASEALSDAASLEADALHDDAVALRVFALDVSREIEARKRRIAELEAAQ